MSLTAKAFHYLQRSPHLAALSTKRRFSLQTSEPDEVSANDQTKARQWLATFGPQSLPRRLCEVSFSRSSGPGGQKVNKLVSGLVWLEDQSLNMGTVEQAPRLP